jgi:hypothetical protein
MNLNSALKTVTTEAKALRRKPRYEITGAELEAMRAKVTRQLQITNGLLDCLEGANIEDVIKNLRE